MDSARESNPNASGPEGLRGDMGVSSERTGPDSESAKRNPEEGTGTKGSAVAETHGTKDTSPAAAGGPGMDDDQQRATDEWRDELPPGTEGQGKQSTGIDRTVGEHNLAEVPSHENDPRKNPGHSHG
jgi:hypothetical protein